MKRLLTLSTAVVLGAAAFTPALAAQTSHDHWRAIHAEPYRPIHRGFAADPSSGNRAGINYAKHTAVA